MKRFSCLQAVLIAFFILSCGSDPEPRDPVRPAVEPSGPAVPESAGVPEQPKPKEPAPEEPKPAAVFDPSSITKEEYDNAKGEVQQLIQKLNAIIKARNYPNWVSYLDDAYFRLINSREYLDRINRTYNLNLYNARDYFTNVVVPSRANDRVDDIEFVSQNRVKAYTISQKGERLRLYDLEKTNESWKIIN
jgi:hypothetical protein